MSRIKKPGKVAGLFSGQLEVAVGSIIHWCRISRFKRDSEGNACSSLGRFLTLVLIRRPRFEMTIVCLSGKASSQSFRRTPISIGGLRNLLRLVLHTIHELPVQQQVQGIYLAHRLPV